MTRLRLLLISLLLPASLICSAQRVLNLEQCRELALSDNKKSQINSELVEAAKDFRRSTVAAFFPRLSANGTYMWNQKNFFLLPDELEGNYGTFMKDGTYHLFDQDWAELLEHLFPDLSSGVSNDLGQLYQDLRSRTELNIHNIFVGQVGIMQPVYLGGRLRETYNLAKGAEKMAELKAQKGDGDIIVDVNEAYWRVVSVQEKLKLATEYVDLLEKLEANVQTAIEEGVATKSDLLKVQLKLNEGRMKKAQAVDGLSLSKMALCQLCGIDLNTDITLDATGLENYVIVADSASINENAAYNRDEVKLLEQGEKMSKSMARLASAGLQPNIVAGVNYVATSPNLFNGFKNEFRGGFNVTVGVNIPIAHADAIYRYKAAKHAANIAKLQLEEAVEKITLQITQSAQKVEDGNNRLRYALSNMESAEETLRLAEEAYNEGVATSTDLMMAQTAWQQAYSEKIDAAINLRMCELTLQQHLGKLKK